MSRLTVNDARVVSASTASRLREMERALDMEHPAGGLGERAKQRAKRLLGRPRTVKDMTSEEIVSGLRSLDEEVVIASFERDHGRAPTADELADGIEYLNSAQGSAEVMRMLAKSFLDRGDNDNATRALALAEGYQKAIDFPPPGSSAPGATPTRRPSGRAAGTFSPISRPEPEELDE